MKKKCTVVMLATCEMSQIIFDERDCGLLLYKVPQRLVKLNEGRFLYITSNDEITECDYAILDNTRIIKVGKNWAKQINKNSLKEYSKRIIATTDPSLHKDGVDKIGLDFIENYITKYNKGNTIKEVNVEYIDFCDYEGEEPSEITPDWRPKLNSDGTIIIHSI